MLPNLFYEASTAHVSKPDTIIRNKNYRSTWLMNTDTKILGKISKSDPTKSNIPKNQKSDLTVYKRNCPP